MQAEFVQRRALAARFWGIFLAETLDRIVDTYELPEHSELAATFKGDAIEDEVADAFARSLILYAEGDFDLAVHNIVPRIENVIRTMCRMIGMVIIKQPEGALAGGVVGLGTLLEALRGKLPGVYREYLTAVLTDPLGMNLRNNVSHGLASSFSRTDAAILIQIALLLGNMGVTENPQQS